MSHIEKKINEEIVSDYIECPRKGFLSLIEPETGIEHDYSGVLRNRKNKAVQIYLDSNQEKIVATEFDSENKRPHMQNSLFYNVMISVDDLETKIDFLLNSSGKSSLGKTSNQPILVTGNRNVSRKDKVKLAFISLVLENKLRKRPESGIILTSQNIQTKIKINATPKNVMKAIQVLRRWKTGEDGPPTFLNKNCNGCRYQVMCKDVAQKEDNLSLLDRMTPKLVQRYQKKGIFTVQQLSFLFKPRRGKKRKIDRIHRFNHELQALAIRTNKTFVQSLPVFNRPSIEFFVDFEGIPDQKFQYLFGLLTIVDGIQSFQSFWADDLTKEEVAWQSFVKAVNKYPSAPIYHYGSYEAKAVKHLEKIYSSKSTASISERLVNINPIIFGKIYFPVISNGLKELGQHVGSTWSSTKASGLQSLVWRSQWDEYKDEYAKDFLFAYNQEDCLALMNLVSKISDISKSANDQTEVDFATNPKRITSESGAIAHATFDQIIKSGHATYNKNKITSRMLKDVEDVKLKNSSNRKSRQRSYSALPKSIGKVVHVRQRKICVRHKGEKLITSRTRTAQKIVVDLHFSKNGCKKTITRYTAPYGYCPTSHHYYSPAVFSKFWQGPFGHSLRSWAIHQRVVLKLPYEAIAITFADLFGIKVAPTTIIKFVTDHAEYYANTEKKIIKEILQSPFIHADETKLNIQGVNQYVWVFTDGKRVVFKLSEGRDSEIAHEFLQTYQGILISDFYPGYDSIHCPQQKCLVHLIRDINEDLWKYPFNKEFEIFVVALRDLLSPIFDAINKYGSKKRNLNKFEKNVVKFYKNTIDQPVYDFDTTIKYQKRFQRYRDSLFTFLKYDLIPWNNNMAERAIRHLAVQRKISGYFYKDRVPPYLLMLSIAQTCRFQDKSFLKFLISQRKDLENFKTKRILRPSKKQSCVGLSELNL